MKPPPKKKTPTCKRTPIPQALLSHVSFHSAGTIPPTSPGFSNSFCLPPTKTHGSRHVREFLQVVWQGDRAWEREMESNRWHGVFRLLVRFKGLFDVGIRKKGDGYEQAPPGGGGGVGNHETEFLSLRQVDFALVFIWVEDVTLKHFPSSFPRKSFLGPRTRGLYRPPTLDRNLDAPPPFIKNPPNRFWNDFFFFLYRYQIVFSYYLFSRTKTGLFPTGIIMGWDYFSGIWWLLSHTILPPWGWFVL